MKQIKSLNGLRGIAALLVLWVHFPQLGNSQICSLFKKFGQIIDAGYLGVDIFFVLSGFLITRILLCDKRENRFSFRVFYLKRVLRIFPIYYLAIIFCYFFVSEGGFWPSFFYVSNYYFAFNSGVVSPLTHTWSLAVEEQFYLCWPLLLYFLSIEKAKKVIIYLLPLLAILAAIMTEFLLDQKTAGDLIYRGVQYRMLSLCFGSAMAFYEPEILKIKPIIPVFVSLAGAVVIGLGLYLKGGIISYGHTTVLLLGASLISLGIVMFSLVIDLRPNSLFSRLLGSQILLFVGKISYGLYLYHFIVIFYFGYAHTQGVYSIAPSQGIPMLLLCILIPYLSFNYFERPILKAKDKLGSGTKREV